MRIVVSRVLLALCVVGALVVCQGSYTNITQLATKTMFSATALTGNGTITSSATTATGRSINLSVQYRVASGVAADVTFKVLTSLDETNFSVPDSGGTIKANVTDNNWHMAILSIPVAKAVQLQAVSNNAAATTIDAILGLQ